MPDWVPLVGPGPGEVTGIPLDSFLFGSSAWVLCPCVGLLPKRAGER